MQKEKKVKSRRGYCHRTRDDLMNPVTDYSLCNRDIKEKKKTQTIRFCFHPVTVTKFLIDLWGYLEQ